MSEFFIIVAVLLSVTTAQVNFVKSYLTESQEGPLKRIFAKNPLYVEEEIEEAEYEEEEENDENLERDDTNEQAEGTMKDENSPGNFVLAKPEVEADTPDLAPPSSRHGWGSVEDSVIRAERKENLNSSRRRFQLIWLLIVATVIVLIYYSYRRNRSKIRKSLSYHEGFKQ